MQSITICMLNTITYVRTINEPRTIKRNSTKWNYSLLSVLIEMRHPLYYVKQYDNIITIRPVSKNIHETIRIVLLFFVTALLMAARLHEFSRQPGDIVKIVKVHESTLRRR